MELVSKIRFCFCNWEKKGKNVIETWQKFAILAKIHHNFPKIDQKKAKICLK